MALYRNARAVAQVITTATFNYEFPVGGYYVANTELTPYVASGLLESVADSYESTTGAVLATRTPRSSDVSLLTLDTKLDQIEHIVEDEIDHHFHNRERWRGQRIGQTAVSWAADSLTPFRAISGNNAYGADPGDEAFVLGSADTPIISGMTLFDFHRLLIITQSVITVYKLRVIWGTGTMAVAIAAGQFTESMVISNSALGIVAGGSPSEIMMPRVACGTQVWIQAWNATNNATIDFLIGLHEYAQ